jgi:POT family proton-dependent oligopeptide transporter
MPPSDSLTPSTAASSDTRFFGHPLGLSTLFFAELWERFSYYGMRAILVLFMTTPVALGGLGYGDGKAGIIYGVYTSMVYLLSLAGGFIADRFVGARKAVFSGGLLIMAGHISLAIPFEQTFMLGLVLVALGTGMLKPNISVMVGQLYAPEDVRRDAGFSIYYMGINIGGFLAPLACGFLAQHPTFRDFLVSVGIDPHNSWHFGFAMAAFGMALGLIWFVVGGRHLGTAGLHPVPPETPAVARQNKRILIATLLAIFGIPLLLGGLASVGVFAITADLLGDVVGATLLIVTIGFFVLLFTVGKWTPEERKRLIVIVPLFIGAAVFWACFEQAGSTFNLFAERNTRPEMAGITIPASWYQSLNSLFIIALAPVFASLWIYLARHKKDLSSVAKFAIAMVLVAIGLVVMYFAALAAEGGSRVSPNWLVILYFIHTCAELCLSPVGLSSMTKLAPARIGGLIMGLWFVASANGNYVAGFAASKLERMPMTQIFTVLAATAAGTGLVLFALVRPLRRMLARS